MKTTKTLMTILTITLLIGGCGSNPMSLSSLPLLQASNIQQDTLPAITRTISVTGNAEVRVVPDEVILTLGAESFDKDLQAAKLENDKIIRKVFDIAKDLNIENKYIQTDYINIEPRYDTYINKRVLLGYAARKTIAITLKDISQFDLLLSSVLEAGVNYVHGIEFRTTELRIYRDQARVLALKAAQEKANAMAVELDQEIAEPLAIREEYSNWWSGYNSWWGYGMSGSMSQNVLQNSQSVPPDSENALALGQIAVNANVSVEFRLK